MIGVEAITIYHKSLLTFVYKPLNIREGMTIMDIDTDALQGVYKKLNELLGTDEMLKFYQEFRGTQLNLPMKLYDRNGTVAAIKDNYPQMSEKQLADKYGYSQRWVKRVISESKD